MAKKIRVGISFGGRSGEHEISLFSAASVFKAIDQQKYEVVPIGITKKADGLLLPMRSVCLRASRWSLSGSCVPATPDTTAAAAVLQTGEAVVVPPEPHKAGAGMTPFQTEAPAPRRRPRHQRGCNLSRSSWDVWRRRHRQGCSSWQKSLCRRRRAGLRRRHGQGHYEIPVSRRGFAYRQARDHSSQRSGVGSPRKSKSD